MRTPQEIDEKLAETIRQVYKRPLMFARKHDVERSLWDFHWAWAIVHNLEKQLRDIHSETLREHHAPAGFFSRFRHDNPTASDDDALAFTLDEWRRISRTLPFHEQRKNVPRLRFSLRLLLVAPLAAALAIHLWPAGQDGPMEFNIGTVSVGSQIVHTFEVQNRTGRPLRLALGGCGCPDRCELTDDRLMQGEISYFDAALSVRSGQEPGARIEVHYELLTDIPDRPRITFRLVGNVATPADHNSTRNNRMRRNTRVEVFEDGTLYARPR
ncbi:hypothetical protein Enr13x_20080 [Stieleria neptunia]|uniref:DUF1573 domain-containing protein n=1 Tax=Stieleria neptunia TaxID=2527979 RepID=A0A518HMT5_9BACT|nr:hypothetical protein [Stieleria neptunia]QDV42165.1 hypothetical protein Enr13x_20080 [Stieleria neptunia]